MTLRQVPALRIRPNTIVARRRQAKARSTPAHDSRRGTGHSDGQQGITVSIMIDPRAASPAGHLRPPVVPHGRQRAEMRSCSEACKVCSCVRPCACADVAPTRRGRPGNEHSPRGSCGGGREELSARSMHAYVCACVCGQRCSAPGGSI